MDMHTNIIVGHTGNINLGAYRKHVQDTPLQASITQHLHCRDGWACEGLDTQGKVKRSTKGSNNNQVVVQK